MSATEFQERVLDSLDTLKTEMGDVKVQLAEWKTHIYRLGELESRTGKIEKQIAPIADKYGVAKGLAALILIGAAVTAMLVHVKNLFAWGK